MTDETIIPDGECALVSTAGMQGLELLIPNMGDNDEVPDLALFLTGCLVRMEDDPGFFEEMVEWVKSGFERPVYSS